VKALEVAGGGGAANKRKTQYYNHGSESAREGGGTKEKNKGCIITKYLLGLKFDNPKRAVPKV